MKQVALRRRFAPPLRLVSASFNLCYPLRTPLLLFLRSVFSKVAPCRRFAPPVRLEPAPFYLRNPLRTPLLRIPPLRIL